jgi:hypothetical protein
VGEPAALEIRGWWRHDVVVHRWRRRGDEHVGAGVHGDHGARQASDGASDTDDVNFFVPHC